MHHDAPAVILQVALYFDAERSVIPGAVESAVDLARLKDEATPLTQANDFFHPLGVGRRAHSHRRLHGSENVVEAFVPNAFPSAADTAAATTTVTYVCGSTFTSVFTELAMKHWSCAP